MTDQQLEKEFFNYVKHGADMPKQAPDNMLIAYGFFKQATVGDVDKNRPNSNSDVIRALMFDQWERMKGMSKEAAMRAYIDHIKKLFKEQGLAMKSKV